MLAADPRRHDGRQSIPPSTAMDFALPLRGGGGVMGLARLTMRILGYLLLILGFVGMPIFFQAEYHAITGWTLGHAAKSLNAGIDTKTYSWQEILDAFEGAFEQTAKSIPLIFPPTILMLTGGILLDVASRRHKKAKEQSKNS
jgi:hypothetical protein